MIGFVDTSNRAVRPITEIAQLVDFKKLDHTDPILHPNGTVEQTVQFMKDIVRKHHTDVQKIADRLYNPKVTKFLQNVFDFVMTYVRYEKDSVFMEQLRLPLRTLQDQCGDCDCMSILIGSILYAKGIPFNFRITKYDGKSEFSHVYVIVPRTWGYTVVDPVIKKFDKEKPFTMKADYVVDNMLSGFSGLNGMPIQLLNGHSYISGISLAGGLYGLYGDLMAVTMGTDLMGYGLGSSDEDETAMYNHLVRTRDVILAKPQMFKIMRNPLEVARMLDYAIRYWDTPQIDHVLGVLEDEEQRLLREGVIVYPHADLSGAELGELGKGIFKKIGAAVKKGVKKVGSVVKKVHQKAVAVTKKVGKAVATAAKKTGKAVAKGVKAVAKVVARFNPVSLAARGGLLLAIRTNMFKLADKLQYGLYTEAQATAAGINLNDFRAMQESYNKAKKIFCNTLQGKEDKFKQAIQKGVKHKAIKGLEGVGELGAVAAATVTAAMGFIAAILKMFSGKKNPATGETITEDNVSEGEVNDLMNQAESYDEDGNPIGTPVDTTANEPAEEQTFLQKAGSFLKNTATNLVSNYLPTNGGGGGGGSTDDEVTENNEDDDMEQSKVMTGNQYAQQQQQSAVKTTVMTSGVMKAVMIGAGVVGVGAAIYFMTKKKKGNGLSGLPSRRKPPKTKRRSAMRSFKAIKLQ